MSDQPPAGWHPDPDDSSQQRYWDGAAWTEHRSPGAEGTGPGPDRTSELPLAAFATATQPPPKKKNALLYVGIPIAACLVLLLLAVVVGAIADSGRDEDRTSSERPVVERSSTTVAATTEALTSSTTQPPATTSEPATTSTLPPPTTTVPPPTTTVPPTTSAPPVTTFPPGTTAPPPTAGPSLMPNVVCLNLQLAQDTIQAAGVFFSRSEDATGQGRFQVLDSNWIVVGQTPVPGTPIGEGDALLAAVKIGEPSPC